MAGKIILTLDTSIPVEYTVLVLFSLLGVHFVRAKSIGAQHSLQQNSRNHRNTTDNRATQEQECSVESSREALRQETLSLNPLLRYK